LDKETVPAKYTIDTCSRTTKRRVYPLDVFPSAWAKLDTLAADGTLISTEQVLEELKAEDDEVFAWARKFRGIFLPLDDNVQVTARKVLETHSNLIDLKRRKSGADPFVVATAIGNACSVVSEEKPSGGPQRSKIPDVCGYYKIECINLLEMLRRERLKLEVQAARRFER
jgi:hypothetical protein